MRIPIRRRRLVLAGGTALVLGLTVAAVPSIASARDDDDGGLDSIRQIVVIYEENHSFDNLFGGWEGVNGIRQASSVLDRAVLFLDVLAHDT